MTDKPTINIRDLSFVSYNPFTDFNITERICSDLMSKCPHSFFLSWGWISTWLGTLPKNSRLSFVVGSFQDEPVVAFFAGGKNKIRHGAIFTRSINLNSTGDNHFDIIWIEYNTILADPLVSINLLELINYIPLSTWDEFFFPGVSGSIACNIEKLSQAQNDNYTVIIDQRSSSYYVDLQKIREHDMDYYKVLSSNKRQQIRRSIKEYEKKGKIYITPAKSINEALSMLDKLAELHQVEWIKRGNPGAFSNKFFYDFHKTLIQKRFNNNEIQLLHIFNENLTIGYLYNFIYNNNVLFYQSGFNYSLGNNYRPGLISHFLAVQYNAEMNYSIYDFLAGDSQYKQSLSTDSNTIIWAKIQKRRKRFSLERSLKNIKSQLASLF